MRRRFALILAVGVAVVGGVAATADSGNDTASAPVGAPQGGLGSFDARSFSDFALYWLGDRFEGLPLKASTRRNEPRAPGEKVRTDYVGFIYGDCVASNESGCPPPLEVQVWPACVRSLADYRLTPAGVPLPRESVTVRGVPAAYFENGLRLELYTGKATVVIFGLERAQIRRAAAALRGANALASSAATLPPPARGAMNGTLGCDE